MKLKVYLKESLKVLSGKLEKTVRAFGTGHRIVVDLAQQRTGLERRNETGGTRSVLLNVLDDR